MSRKVIIAVSDAKISNNPEDVLATYSLGSCIGVCVYDVQTKIGGMLHYQLPDSKMGQESSKDKPFMFADTGMKILIDKLLAIGARKAHMQVKISGGASMQTGPKGFDIGKRNYLAIRKILWQNGLLVNAADIGGNSPRNMYMNMANGNVTVRSTGVEKSL